MDIFSHSLWAGAISYAAKHNLEKRTKHKFHILVGIFFSVFPDLFAFSFPFAWFAWKFLSGDMSFGELPGPGDAEPFRLAGFWVFDLAQNLYVVSHSLVIFAIVFFITWKILKRPAFELLGWPLHILIDIPTHSYEFYPTPVFWPISTASLDGAEWKNPLVFGLNFLALAIVYLAILLHYKAKKHSWFKGNSRLQKH